MNHSRYRGCARRGTTMKIKKIITMISISIFLCIAGLYYCLQQNADMDNGIIETCQVTSEKSITKDKIVESKEDVKDTAAKIFVHVCGAVKKAGVYELNEGDRICNAISAAGGFKKNADQTFLNQAKTLSDGEQVIVPLKDKNIEATKGQAIEKEEKKVSINLGSCEELMTLPGIGEAKANSIIKYREENGSFQSLEELKNIQGIKDGVYNKIVDNIML